MQFNAAHLLVFYSLVRSLISSILNQMPASKNSPNLSEFVSLLTEHQSVMRGYITKLIPNVSDVRDVLQITNVALWERREDFTMGTNFQAWALATARFRAMQHRQKMKRDNVLVFDDDLVEVLAEETNVDLEKTEEMKIALEVCLGKLKPRDAALVSARYHESVPLAEYAHTDGRTEGSLRVILNRLRSSLKDCIDNQVRSTPPPFST